MNAGRIFINTKRHSIFWGYIKPLRHQQFNGIAILLNVGISSKFHTCVPLSHPAELEFKNVQIDGPSILQPVSKSSATALRIKKISRAMKAYLERAKNHDVFLSVKNDEFEIGKHHLANMMGLDVGTLTQEDIDKAIQYLLPSGLYDPKARPVMKPPEELFPKEKAAQFDASGRPFSPFFFTIKTNFYKTMHQIVEKFHELDALEDKMLRKGIATPPEENQVDLSGGTWLTIEEFRSIFLEKLTDTDYNYLISSLVRLAEHPYGFQMKDFIWQFRKDFVDVSALETIPELLYDDSGRPYMKAEGKHKTSISKVTVWGNGTGKIDINGEDINYFYRVENRQQIMLPLEVCGLIGKMDFKATVESGGTTSQASAIRYALSMCLRCFVSVECHERMRLAGLLTLDKRKIERKKPGQKGARAKYRWCKR